MDFGMWGDVILFGIVPTIIYIGGGLYILSLEHIKKRSGYKLPALIYFISVPSLILIAVILHFGMTYMTGGFENKYGPKPPSYEIYKFLVLKDIIPRSGQSLDEETAVENTKVTKKETKENKESIFEDYGTIENDYGKYHGQIKDGKPHGYGTLTFNNGDYYRGDWEDGNKIREGYFVFTFDNGDKYSGELYNGLFHGQGSYYFKELGHTYEGEFKNHEETFGTMNYSDGRKYIGEFKNDLKHGQGTLVFPDGKKMVGNWKNDKFIDQTTAVLNITTNEKYYALVIGNNNYEHLEKLDAAENDAEVIADVLTNKYGFEVDLLLNADYEKTVDTLFQITNKLKRNDNLLIYYAGHGELDKAENRGYWLPVDASYEQRSKWISNQRIVDRIKATKAKHVLLIADSCFSGTLMRSGITPEANEAIDEKYIERLKSKKTRLVITSGGNEPVVDSDGGDHSLFALKLIDTLKNNNTVINSQILFENIRRYVVSNADQTPERAMVHKTGHDGGDFLFFPKN